MPSAYSSQSFAVFQTEDTWGTIGTPPSYFIPLTNYGVVLEKQQRDLKAYCGVRSIKKTENVRQWPQGQISCALSGIEPAGQTVSFARYLLEWAFANPEQTDLPSKSVRWIEGGAGGSQKWHSGLRVNQATLAGQVGGFVTLSLDVIGKSEVENEDGFTVPDDRSGLWKFLFADSTFSLDGVNFPIESFSWQANFNLAPKFNGFEPSVLRSEHYESTLTVTPKKTSNVWEENHRTEAVTETDAVLTLEGLHGGTGASGTRTKVSLAFNNLSLEKAVDTIPPEDYIKNPLTFKVLKPNSSAKHVTQTWSLV